MNSRSFLKLLVALFSLSSLVSANADTPLETSMKSMSKAYKALFLDLKQPAEANKADYLALTGTLKTQAQNARGLVPKKAAALPADQQNTMVAAYQKSMDTLIQTIDSLSQEIQDSKWDDAHKTMDAIKQQMIDGHKAFRQKEGATSTPVPAPTPAPTAAP
jgi:soluble cytochrome b562